MSYRPPPSMASIRRRKPNGLTAVSTFSGCGGSSLGYRMAGFRVVSASEFVPAAAEVYEMNAPGTVVLRDDVRAISGWQLLKPGGLKKGELDLLDGSPPCSAFSMAGIREAGWGDVKVYSDTEQRVDDLFFEFARLVDEIQPRIFVAENVAGLTKGTARGYLRLIVERLEACGYVVRARLLDAQWLGVPQRRVRLILIGARADLELEPEHPRPFSWRPTIADALPHLAGQIAPRSGSDGWSDLPGWNDADDDVSQTIGASPSTGNGRFPANIVGHRIVGYTDRSFDTDIEVRPLDEPAPTVGSTGWGGAQRAEVTLAGAPERMLDVSKLPAMLDPETGYDLRTLSPRIQSQYPTRFLRRLTIAELRRICGFPDDFKLSGSYAQRWERLGRAVPPTMMREIARTVERQLASLG